LNKTIILHSWSIAILLRFFNVLQPKNYFYDLPVRSTIIGFGID